MKIDLLCHSSINIISEKRNIYIDPFNVKESRNDASVIFITHSHYDHFSEEDILKVKDSETEIVITNDLLEKTIKLGFEKDKIHTVIPNEEYSVKGINFRTIPAYNTNKKFHPKENNWVGYILNIEGISCYIAGDTDITEENKKVKCDIALVPIGGTYTMNYMEAAELVNIIKPKKTIPIHYGEIVGKKEDAKEFEKLINKSIECEVLI